MSNNAKIQEYKASLPALQEYIPGLSQEKNGECYGGCPMCGGNDKSDRFRVFVKDQRFWCRHDGCELGGSGGDMIDFIRITKGVGLKEQMEEAGLLPEHQPRKQSKSRAEPRKIEPRGTSTRNTAAFIWNKSKDSEVPYQYLEQTRKLKMEERSTAIKFNSYADKEGILHEMIVLKMWKPGDDEPKAVQRIFIKNDDGIWKKTGTALCNGEDRAAVGRAVWFRPDLPKQVVAVGEGPETMISVGLATGLNYVSCLTASGIKNIQLPEETEDVYFFIDCDAKEGKNGGDGFAGQKAGLAAAKRAEKQGKRVFVVTPTADTFSDEPQKTDFNDLYKQDTTGQSIRERLAAAMPPGDIDWKIPKKKKPKDEGDYPDGTLELLQEVNKEYAACLVSGKFRVSREFVSETRGFHTVEFLEVGSFKNFYANKKCNVFVGEYGRTKKVGLADTWMEWDGRKSYKTVVFDPSNNVSEEAYNLWKGFAVKPVQGNWELFKSHMFQVLCDENNEHFDYLMAWMARIVQDPGGKRPGVALVLQGNKGAGKGTFFHIFGTLFGESYVHVSTKKGITGDFNMHLAKGILLFADEATWAGDHTAEGRLKAIITEPTIDFEPKGVDRIPMKCHINMGIACNDEWAVNATEDERRYFVLKIPPKDYTTTAYFNSIWEEMENGGYEAMMFDLLNLDIKINLRKAPVTAGLIGQIEESLSRPMEFWHEVLSRGFLLSDQYTGAPVASKRGLGRVDWPESVWKYELIYEFKEIFERRSRFPVKTQSFWKETRKFWAWEERQHLDEDNKRPRAITIPDIDDLRALFTQHTGIVFNEEKTELEPTPF